MHFTKQLYALLLLPAFLQGCFKKEHKAPYEILAIHAANMDNSGADPVAAPDSVYKLAFVLALTYEAVLIDPEESEYDSYESSMYNRDHFTSFSITCPVDFDATHPAGTPLNDLFDLGMTTKGGVSLNQIVGKIDYPVHQVDLWLMSPPTLDGTYQFTLEFTSESGKVLTATTPAIILHS
jgi:hypothetical protein